MAITDHPAMRSRGGNPYLPHSLRDDSNVIPFPHRPAAPLQVRGGVPVGTSVQIQEWVGDDPERAKLALAREKESERPRITLLSHLQGVLKKQGVAVDPEEQPETDAAPEPILGVVAPPVEPDDDDGDLTLIEVESR